MALKPESFNPIAAYLTKTHFIRKILDVFLILVLLIGWGIARGSIKLPTIVNTSTTHTVEHTFKQSNEIQKILDVEQYQNKYNFVGSFRFNNGTVALDSFNFMKYSLTEYSSGLGIMVDPLEMQNIPIVVNMPMVQSLVEGKCFSSVPKPSSPTYIIALKMNVQSYTACPVRNRHGYLVGFVSVGVNSPTPPTDAAVIKITDQIKIFQK